MSPTKAAVLKSCGHSDRLHPRGSSIHWALWPQALGDPAVPLPGTLGPNPGTEINGTQRQVMKEGKKMMKRLRRSEVNNLPNIQRMSPSQDANAGPSVQTLPVTLRDPAGEKRRNKHSDLAPFLPSGLPVSLQRKPEGTEAPCSTPPIASTQVSLQVGTQRLPRTSSLPQPRSTAGGRLPLCTRAGWHTCLHPKLVQQHRASPSFLIPTPRPALLLSHAEISRGLL